MAHTPGPWTYHKNKGVRSIDAPSCRFLFDDERYYPSCSENEDDWPLIAAAPDLLAACKALNALPLIPYPENARTPLCDALALVQAAVAKAEGR